MNDFIIYIATNKTNGHSYVGATSRGLEVRKSSHFEASRISRPGCRKFYRAIRKYGEDAFVWKELIKCSSKEEMMKEEIRIISELKPEYNLTAGGEGVIGYERTDEWKEKVSLAQKGKQKLKSSIPIICLNDGNLFPSIKSAAEFYNVGRRLITEVLRKRSITTTNGLQFSYSKVPISKQLREEAINANLERKKESLTRKKGRSVICINDNKKYKSLTCAAIYYEISLPSVFQLCKTGRKTKSGLMFEYAK